jgi:hydroxymethylbilane synthase
VSLRIGTRGSALARRQVDLAIEAIATIAPDMQCDVIVVQTEGDRRLDVSLDSVGGQGVFVKEIEQRILSGEIDLAVHSLKDMPSETAPGLRIGALLPRTDARDALVARDGLDLAGLPEGARIGSDSRRRGAQLLAMRSDLSIQGIRGNVDTRLRKVDTGEYDAVALAVAGLERLGLRERATQVFSPDEVVPAPGQGAIALECRSDDADTLGLLAGIDHAATRATTEAERSFLRELGAGCSLPIGAHAMIREGRLEIVAVLADDGGKLHRGRSGGEISAAGTIGRALAMRLKAEAGV